MFGWFKVAGLTILSEQKEYEAVKAKILSGNVAYNLIDCPSNVSMGIFPSQKGSHFRNHRKLKALKKKKLHLTNDLIQMLRSRIHKELPHSAGPAFADF
jgi:hypothetical protein